MADTTEETSTGATSWLGAFRRLGTGLARIAQCRSELLSVELQEEKYRVLTLFLLAGSMLLFAMLAVVAFTAAVVWICPEGARPYVAAGFGLLYAGMAAGAGLGLRRELQQRPPPLSGTVGELKKDVEWLRSKI